MMDCLVRGGTVVTQTDIIRADIGIAGGRIVAILDAATPAPEARTAIDAGGLLVMPGAIDAHTHFTGSHSHYAEELRDGTRGAAIGGVTTVIEMPHSDPIATTLAGFAWKRDLAAAHASVDFALWAGLDRTNVDQLAALDREGAVAFKGFMCSGDPAGRATDASGLPALDDDSLLQAMREIARFNGLIGLHAENHSVLIGARARLLAAGRHDAAAHAEAGPEIAELEAVSRALLYARETGVRCHIVHLSSARAAALIQAARATTRISVETCPQYLLLDEDDLIRIGAPARCGPPMRKPAIVADLWQHVLNGDIDTLASDHCPYLPERKLRDMPSIWDAGMGLTGIETAVPLFFSGGVQHRGLSPVAFAQMTATAPAKLFGLASRKGAIAIGRDADLALYDPEESWTVRGAAFQGMGKWSAFEGMTCRGRVQRTLVRGTTVYHQESFGVDPGYGRFLPRNARAV